MTTSTAAAIRPTTTVESAAPVVHLLGSFRVTWSDELQTLPVSTWRLLGFLALQRRMLDRSYVANCLWLDKSECRAQANLRSCLWRLRQAEAPLVEVSASHLRLRPSVVVDTDGLFAIARGLMDSTREFSGDELDALDPGVFGADLLPDWYDDFVELERERLRQVRLHAVEALARRLAAAGRITRALEVALTAVAAEPLRESAHLIVIKAHLCEGNISEALRQHRLLCTILDRQLGIAPSPAVTEVLRPWLGPDPPPGSAGSVWPQ